MSNVADKYMVLVEGRGYLQARNRLGPMETARRFTHESAHKAAAACSRRVKGAWVEVIRCSPLQDRHETR